MITSPILAQPAHLSNSPTASPTLRPAEGVMAGTQDRATRAVTRNQQRPYCSPRIARSSSRQRGGEVDATTRSFALAIVEIARARKAQAALRGVSPTHACPSSPGRECQHLVELVVDVPVWSAGCFADLSTLHALRDNTLQRVHSLIGHLNEEHAIQSTYKLLARSPSAVGWGAIRVAPSPLDGPGVHSPSRRTSFVKPERQGSGGVASPPRRMSDYACSSFDNAIADSDSEHSVDLTETDDEDEANAMIKAEVERRKEKEGSSFVMNVQGALSLIVV